MLRTLFGVVSTKEPFMESRISIANEPFEVEIVQCVQTTPPNLRLAVDFA
jgi:hypothetical protein